MDYLVRISLSLTYLNFHNMKKNLLLAGLGLGLIATLFMSNSGGRAAVGNADNTGSPVSQGTCANCHSGGNFGATVVVNLYSPGTTTPATQYVPDSTYEVEVIINDNGAAGYGFQLACLNADNESVNGFSTPGSDVQITTLANGREIVEQSRRRTDGRATVSWTAPSVGTGDVTFYAVGNAVNGNGGTSGDQVVTTSITLNESPGVSTRQQALLPVSLTLFPNPVASHLFLDIVGSTSGTHQLLIVNTLGQVVERRNVEIAFGMDRIDLDVAHLPRGHYQLVLAQEGRRIAQPFIKQ